MLQVYLRYMILGPLHKGDRQEINNDPKFTDINRSLMNIVQESEVDKTVVQTSEVVQGYCDDVSKIISRGLDCINNDIFGDKYFCIDDAYVLIADNDKKYFANMEMGSGYVESPNRKRKSIVFGKNDPDDLIRVLKDNNIPLNNSTSHINVDVVGWHRDEPINMVPPNFI